MGARTAAPGGGSVSALLAALGAGLGSMVIGDGDGDGDQHFTSVEFSSRLGSMYGDGNHRKRSYACQMIIMPLSLRKEGIKDQNIFPEN